VQAALAHVPDDVTHVAVHDAARPAAPAAMLDRLFEAASMVPAVIPGVPIQATVKRGTADAVTLEPRDDDDALADMILGDAGRAAIEARAVTETVDRRDLYAIQTPQIFEVELLRRAYAQDDLTGATDDASLVERLGEPVQIVAGDIRNLKVTTQEDLELVRAILALKPPAERPAHKRF
jgi:2-C-methyl-D-erythritol 4-phosphate cytidylyltransferase